MFSLSCSYRDFFLREAFNLLKKAWIKIIFVFLFVWLIVSIFFYTQHEIIIWNYQVNQQIELKDVKIDIEEIFVRNYRSNNKFYNNSLIYDIASKLPHQLPLGFLKICYFYSKPYDINNNYGVVSIKGQIVSNGPINDERNIEIEVIDDIGVHYSSFNWRSFEPDSNIVGFMTGGDFFPFEKLGSTLKISIKDKREDKTTEIIVNPTFTGHSYGFFDNKPKVF